MSVRRVRKLPHAQVEEKPVRNVELEQLRNEGLNTILDDEKLAKELADELALVHSAYLFYGSGRWALRKICLVVASTPSNLNVVSISTWKDLAAQLGLTFHEIGYIENMRSDCTEYVLKTYAFNEMDGTLDKIIMALCKLKRFDAISEAKDDLKGSAELARREQVYGEGEDRNHDDILRPIRWSQMKSQLPLALRRHLDITSIAETISNIEFPRIEDNIQQATVIDRRQSNRNKCSKRVMLTFAKDGEETAYKVAAQLRKPREHYLPIGVLILEDHYDRVEANPMAFITNVFSKLDYIIPIVTPQYLKSIDKIPLPVENDMCALDTRYVQMIHTLMGHYYLKNACRNDKFRPIIPDDHLPSLLKNHRMEIDPILQVFVTESNLEYLALRMLKKK